MASKADGLRDYNEVSQRVEAFNQDYPAGRIVTQAIELTDDRVTVRAEVFRTPDQPEPDGTGMSWLNIPGTTNFTRGSELENAETSAVGRALAFIGYYAKGESLASKQEIEAKGGEARATRSKKRTGVNRSSDEQVATDAAQKPITDRQKKLLEARMREVGVTGDKRKALILFGVEKHSSKDLVQSDVDRLLAIMDDRDAHADVWENVDMVAGEDA